MSMKALLDACVEQGASDLHLSVGRPPVLRLHGRLVPMDGAEPLTPAATEALLAEVLPSELRREVDERGGADFALAHERARFRVSAFRQKSHLGLVLRQIPNEVLSLEKIGLPAAVTGLLAKPRGLILVTGPTGSGKSTTLAAMIDHINRTTDRHIITIEDPIEFVHGHKKSLVTQREVGADVPSFSEALRRALRQDPDVILVGELRDLETIGAALTAAETGHLVMGTLHTTGAAETVTRIIDAFPPSQQDQVRTQVAGGLVAVISQLLIPRQDGPGRVAAFEVMINTPAIGHLVRENKTHRIASEIQTGKRLGMLLLDEVLADLVGRGVITREDALEQAVDQEDMQRRLGEGGAGAGGGASAPPASKSTPPGWG